MFHLRARQGVGGPEGMTTYRIITGIALCVCLVFVFYYPWTVFFLLPLWVAFALLLWKIAMVPISDPERAIIFRMEVFHHISKPGYVFLIPTFDRIAGTFAVKEEPLDVKVTQFYASDGKDKMTCNIELAWRVRNDVEGRVSEKVREMVLMDDEQRKKLVEQIVISIVRQLGLGYTSAELKNNQMRERFCSTARQAANEILENFGLTIERLFWRGTGPIHDVQEAWVRGQVESEEVSAMVNAIKTIREQLGGDTNAEDLYAMYEFIKMMKSGGYNPFTRGNNRT
jgi:hypothetical protein